MGMKRSQAAEFYEYVIEAAELIERGGYRLHDGVNKEVAFTEVFTEDLNGIEDLFVKLFGPLWKLIDLQFEVASFMGFYGIATGYRLGKRRGIGTSPGMGFNQIISNAGIGRRE